MAVVTRTVSVLVPTTTLLLPFLLLLSLPLAPPTEAGPAHHAWRYLFPFFPEELDILLGHLRTTVVRLEEVLEQCQDMLEGEWQGGDDPIGVMQLSAADSDDNGSGNGKGDSVEEKVDQIVELREVISDLEDEIEECRFQFWTGAEED